MKHSLVKLVIISVGIVVANSALSMEPNQPPEHEHKMIQMPENIKEPKLNLVLNRDEKSGFNLEIVTQNFELEPPEKRGCCDKSILEGHGHIFINGKKIYRAYGPYIHLPGNLFKPGINQVMVSLNDHDHNTWSRGSKMVMSTVVINVDKEDFMQHAFNTFQ